jgi:RNA polymerase sigma-70 factor (ECF subfamily)
MARYRAIDILRRERAVQVDPFVLGESLAEVSGESDAQDLELTNAQALELCLQRLSSEQRDSIKLAFIGGRSHPEVAAALQRPVGSVKSWIRRGLVALKDCIESCNLRTTN